MTLPTACSELWANIKIQLLNEFFQLCRPPARARHQAGPGDGALTWPLIGPLAQSLASDWLALTLLWAGDHTHSGPGNTREDPQRDESCRWPFQPIRGDGQETLPMRRKMFSVCSCFKFLSFKNYSATNITLVPKTIIMPKCLEVVHIMVPKKS